MTRARQIILVTSLTLAAAGGGSIEHRIAVHQRDQLTAWRARLDDMDTTIVQQRIQLEQIQTEHEAVEHEIAASRARLAADEASSALKLWAGRVRLVKQLLDEMPDQAIPEIRLLTPMDWIQIVRTTELDTADNIRTILASVRVHARKRFSEKLQDALRRFTAASNGELPRELHQLVSWLSAPADAEMLSRYRLIRSGRLDASNDYIVREALHSDMIASVGLDQFNITSNSDWQSPSDEDHLEASDRVMAAMSNAFDLPAGDLFRISARGVLDLMDRATAQLGRVYGDEEAFGEEMKRAAERFLATHPRETLTTLAQLLPHLDKGDELTGIARHVFAHFEYMRDHAGQLSSDPSQLHRYLETPFDPADALRAVKITFDPADRTLTTTWSLPELSRPK